MPRVRRSVLATSRIKQEKISIGTAMAVPIAFFATISANAKIGESIFFFPLAVALMENFLTIFRIFARINGFYGQRNHNNGEHPCQDIRDSRAEGDAGQRLGSLVQYGDFSTKAFC